jgi:hypothetical protein
MPAPLVWADYKGRSVVTQVSESDPLGYRGLGTVLRACGIWYASTGEGRAATFQRVANRKEGKELVEATLILKGQT